MVDIWIVFPFSLWKQLHYEDDYTRALSSGTQCPGIELLDYYSSTFNYFEELPRSFQSGCTT